MNINNSELQFLVNLCNHLELFACTVHEAKELKKLTDKLIKQREDKRESTRKIVANKRKTDKTYGRSKKEIEMFERRKANEVNRNNQKG